MKIQKYQEGDVMPVRVVCLYANTIPGTSRVTNDDIRD